MKIALPTRENKIDDHFGHCEYYTIYTINEDKILNKEIIPSPQGCGCKSDIAFTLQEMGVELMLAGNMGQGALNKLNGANIQVVRGCNGDVDTVLNEYIKGEISDSGVGCSSHTHNHHEGDHDHHSCSHN